MKTENLITLTAIISLIFIFSSCESEESNSENLQNQQENNLIGDWTISNSSLGWSNNGRQTVYRFKDNGTGLIGEFVSTRNDAYLPDITYPKALKSYYKSNWSIIVGI